MAKFQEIVIRVMVETPEPTGRIVKIAPVVESTTRFRRYSEHKNEWVYLDEMHPCHLLNAFLKEAKDFRAAQILEDEYFREMLRLLGKAAEEEGE